MNTGSGKAEAPLGRRPRRALVFTSAAAALVVTAMLCACHFLSLRNAAALLLFAGFAAVASHRSGVTLLRRYVGNGTPASLGAIRMITCGILLGGTVTAHLASGALLPAEFHHPAGVLRLVDALPIDFPRFLGNAPALRTFQWLTAAVLFIGMVGCRTRVAIPLGAGCYLLLGGILRSDTYPYHQNLLPLYVMAVLAWTPCGDGWSLDRAWRMWRERPVAPASPAPVYGWSRFACWVVIALAYEQAGLSKLRAGGLHWWNAQSVRAFIDRDVLVPARINWALSLHLTAAPDTLFSLLGAAGLAIELAFVLVLVSHTARRLLPAAVILMHVGIFLLQNVLFVDLFVLPLVFYDVTSIPASIGRALARARGRVQVLYDGWCPLCRGTVRTLALLDFFGRLEFLDFRRLDVAEYGRRHALRLTIPELDEEMWVVARGQAYRGFAGYRLLAMVLPPAWPLAPWLFLPGISALATRLYRCVATNRFRPLLCDGQCGRRPVDGGTAAPEMIRSSGGTRRATVAICALTAALMVLWANRVEFYPFTAWQMYTDPPSGPVVYYRLFAIDETGATSAAYFDEAIPVLRDHYVGVLATCFAPGEMRRCRGFLAAVAAAYGARGRRVAGLEVERWLWDVHAGTVDPVSGRLAATFVYRTRARVRLPKRTFGSGPDGTRRGSLGSVGVKFNRVMDGGGPAIDYSEVQSMILGLRTGLNYEADLDIGVRWMDGLVPVGVVWGVSGIRGGDYTDRGGIRQ